MLVATIALLVALAGTQLWGIVCFLAFRTRQSAIGNCLHHQIQVALRHSCHSPTIFALRVLEIIWSRSRRQGVSFDDTLAPAGVPYFSQSRHSHKKVVEDVQDKKGSTGFNSVGGATSTFGQLLVLLPLTAIFAAGLTTMSLFSAQLFKTPGNSALLVSPHCGWPAEISEMSVATPENREASVMLLVPAYVQYQTAKHYVSACYMEAGDGDIPGNEKQCNALPVSRIVSTMTTGEECPFPGAGVCKADKVRVESQVVDSRDTLGINTPDEDRISVKKSLTCVPIDASKWASDWVDGAPFGGLPGDRFKSYAVGRVPNAAPPFSEFPIVASNYSWDMSREPYTVG